MGEARGGFSSDDHFLRCPVIDDPPSESNHNILLGTRPPNLPNVPFPVKHHIFIVMLLAYKMRVIRVTEGFKTGVLAATGGICLVYVASMLLRFFGTEIPLIHESGMVGILFSLFVIVIASLNLVLDFNLIEAGEEAGAPKYMEWYAAFGLMVTLVWLYLEILRLLSKLRRR